MSKLFGILTYHNANNYGAALQAYALQRFLKDNFGEDQAEVIDYQCEGVKKQRSYRYVAGRQNPIKGMLHYYLAISRIKKIEDFCRKHMSLSPNVGSRGALKGIADNYSFLVSGSDQVWNRKWTGGEDTYLQDFHDMHNKKVSYAASFGVSEIPEDWREDYKKLLSDFARMSVREEAGRELVSQQFGLKADVHMDPTLLIPKEAWCRIAASVTPRKPYVLVYMVPYQEAVYQKARKLADDKGLDLYVVSKSLKHYNKYYKGNSAVEEILALFRDADYVVTNSFHGTAFSIIFEKKFLVVLDNKYGYNIRSAQLITTCKAADLSNKPDQVECFDVKWQDVEDILAVERERIRGYFSDIIGR